MSTDVSVVIPTYNRCAFLLKAIGSCFEGNDDLDIEVVVVDDGSTDGTQTRMDALGDDRITYVRQESRGAQKARNRGMRVAEGSFIKFLDDDDILLPGALADEVEVLRETGAAITCGHLRVRSDEREFVFEQNPAPDLISGIFRGSVWTHPHAFLYRAAAAKKCQWNPEVPYHQDTAFAIQATTQGLPEAVTDRPVGLYQDHQYSSISSDVKSVAPVTDRAGLQVQLIEQGIVRLRERGLIETHHRETAARGMWTWGHIIAAYDLNQFSDVHGKIKAILPSFQPTRENGILSGLDALFGASTTEYLTYPFRRLKRALITN